LELGADFSVGDRVSVAATVFEQLTPKFTQVVAFGFPPITTEARIKNRGLELQGRVQLVDRPAVAWVATLAASTLRNRVAFVDPFVNFLYIGAGARDEQPFGALVTRDVIFTDANGDNLPAFSEMQLGAYRTNGTVVPTREISLRTSVALPLRRLTVSAVVDHRGGHRAIDALAWAQCRMSSCRALQDPSVSTQERVEAAMASAVSTRQYVEDGSYTRLGALAVHWRTGLGSIAPRDAVTISLEGRNLATWSPFSGADVEVATATSLRAGNPVIPTVPAIPRSVVLTIDFDLR
jgi:hypothetical protein